jgi:hypothetical protein
MYSTSEHELTVQQYLWPFARPGRMPGGARKPKLQQEMWSWLEEQVKNV